MERNSYAEQLGTAQAAASADRAAADAWKSQQERLAAAGDDKEKALLLATRENSELASRVKQLQEQYEKALNAQGQIVMGAPLPPDLAQPLQALADANPGTLEFDAARGTLKLKSDVTFDKGSAVLANDAKALVNSVAKVLNSDAARNFEFLVAGHTDNTPVSNPATIKAGHIDNMYLSSHRAISVAKALVAQNIAASRIGYIGFGDQRPIASNATAAGQSRNRRVEIMISPTSLKSSPGVQEAVAPGNTNQRKPVLNKDTVSGGAVDQRPILSK
jgi:chemotaxis protein MotB